MLLPRTCAGCGAPPHALCARCIDDLRPPPSEPGPAGLDLLVSLCAYEGRGRDVVSAVKWHGATAACGPLGQLLATAVAHAVGDAAIDAPLVTWVPANAVHRHRRGFDPGGQLALATARALGLPARRLLRRHRGTPQTGRSRAERLAGPHLTPALRLARPAGWPAPLAGRAVLVVDDVCTTGASLVTAAEVLRGSGAPWVGGAVVARTPRSRAAGAAAAYHRSAPEEGHVP